jgi:hypothetical protein
MVGRRKRRATVTVRVSPLGCLQRECNSAPKTAMSVYRDRPCLDSAGKLPVNCLASVIWQLLKCRLIQMEFLRGDHRVPASDLARTLQLSSRAHFCGSSVTQPNSAALFASNVLLMNLLNRCGSVVPGPAGLYNNASFEW